MKNAIFWEWSICGAPCFIETWSNGMLNKTLYFFVRYLLIDI